MLISSCSTKQLSNYKLSNNKKIEKEWIPISGEWKMENHIIEGLGYNLNWAILKTKKKLPPNFELQLKANLKSESLFEIMINFNNDQYIRAYLYKIDQNIVIGKGQFDKNDTGRFGGGKSILTKPFALKNNTWNDIKIRVLNSKLVFIINDTESLSCDIASKNLSSEGSLGILTNGNVIVSEINIQELK